VAILLAAADFERSVRRGILGLGTSPTKEIQSRFFAKNFHGLEAFKDAWRIEVKPRCKLNLAGDTVANWHEFKRAYDFRHRLIHGSTVRLSPDFASGVARSILQASYSIDQLARRHGVDLDRTIRRYKRAEL
jgi:hypothetical protein